MAATVTALHPARAQDHAEARRRRHVERIAWGLGALGVIGQTLVLVWAMS